MSREAIMNRLFFKLALLVCLWYEIAVELHLDSNTAFFIAMLVVFGGWFALRMSGQLVGMLGPRTLSLLVYSVLWLVLFWWFAPSVLSSLPLVLIVFALVALAMIGARCRLVFERERALRGKKLFSDHSAAVVGVILGGLLLAMVSLRTWHSLWPLLGYLLLLGLPFGFGWRMGGMGSPERADAKLGDEETFRDAGLSEER
jgi:hypothetical protein